MLAFVVFFVVAVALSSRKLGALTQQLQARKGRAVAARAMVLSISGGMRNQDSRLYSMTLGLSVDCPGMASYEANAFWEVLDIHVAQLQPGAAIDILVDPLDPGLVFSKSFENDVVAISTYLERQAKPAASGA